MTSELYIGIMSGTSLDGIDLVLSSINEETIEFVEHHFVAMPETTKSALKALGHGDNISLLSLGTLDHQLGHLYADSVLELLNKTDYSATQITAIGCHGQTIYHQPTPPFPFTMQIGDASLIAAKTGIPTVADFRRKDMALGGQGAPLVPAFHQALFKPSSSTQVVLNIGGIANVSVIQPDGSVLGFDTGPGNGLLDQWCELHTQQPYDLNGELAARGNVDQDLLTQLLQDPYFAQQPPKSTGREYFNLNELNTRFSLDEKSHSVEDTQRTLTELTACSIYEAVGHLGQGHKPSLIVCGGGSHNKILMSSLQRYFANWNVAKSDDYGINEDDMEAMAFAWLAYRRFNVMPGNLPEVTGAKQKTTLGCIYLPD